MKVVWKYPVNLQAGPQPILMPVGAKIVHVAPQQQFGTVDTPTLWAEVTLDDLGRPPDPETRTFMLVGTGNPEIPDDGWEHRGTVQLGVFVFHVYEGGL